MLNKLLEDGNTLFRAGKLEDAAYRYEYALKRLPRLASAIQETDQENDDVFVQLRSHLLLNLSRTFRKQKKYAEAVSSASQVLAFKPDSYEALWARGKAKREVGALEDALIDLREAIQMAPQNLELHRFTIRVKEELEAATQTEQTGNPQDAAVETITEISCLV